MIDLASALNSVYTVAALTGILIALYVLIARQETPRRESRAK